MPSKLARSALSLILALGALGAALGTSTALVGCGAVRNTVNSSPNLRWWLFSHFGADKMCPEMLKRSAPLALSPGGETLGRFFPNSCRADVNDATQTVTIRFGGTGYAWTPMAGRMGFSVSAGVEYRPDFEMAEDAMYVYARVNRVVEGPTFAIGSVENKLADWAARSPVGYLASTFGGQIVQGQLMSGFTVIRSEQGDDFTLGILRPPGRPKHPFSLHDDDRMLLASETTGVRAGQVDFLGPFEVGKSDQALFLRFRLNGSAVDALVVSRLYGDPWREALQLGSPLGPPPTPPVTSFVVQPGQDVSQRVRLPPGQYYVVIDNSAVLGVVAPPWTPMNMLGGGTAALSYSVELGDVD